MIVLNEYFDGNVKSLGFEDLQNKATVGVMELGEYEFGTVSPERMTVISGELHAQINKDNNFIAYKKGETFEIPANSKFKVKVITGQSAYFCEFL